MQTLDELGYDVADAADNGPDDPKIIDGKHFLPQHRERIVLVGFRRDLNLKADFTLRDISECFPAQRVTLAQLLDPMVEAKYILTPVLWKYLYRYAKKHQARGNGFWLWNGLSEQSAKRHPYAVCSLLQRWRGNFNRPRLGYGHG